MKSITEFAVFQLQKGLAAHNELTTQGKSPEEVSAALGESFKMEGDKLKHFVNSIEVSKSATTGRLKRVLVVTFAENEKVADKAVKVEEAYYLPEFHQDSRPAATAQDARGKGDGKGGKGRGNNRRGGNDRPAKRNRPADPAATEEIKKFASSDGRADSAPKEG
jgi:hypothetical protein